MCTTNNFMLTTVYGITLCKCPTPVLPPAPPGLHAALIQHTGYLVSRCGVFAARQFATGSSR